MSNIFSIRFHPRPLGLMFRIFSRHFWVVHLLFIGCAAWMASSICVVLIRDRLSVSPGPSPAGKPVSALSAGAEPYEKYSPILERNLFNPGERGLKLLPLAEQKAPGAPASKGTPVSSPGGYLLVGTITGPQGKSWAILQEKGSRRQQIYRIHGNIEGGKILSISRNQIQIERGGEKETLRLSEDEQKPAASATAPAAPSTPLSRKGEEVKKLSANRYVVNREDVAAAVGNVNQFMTQARLKPHFEMDRPAGYSVSEIVPGSLMEKLGLRNGDIVRKVNGTAITRPEEIMQAYAQLQRDSNIEVEIERAGRSEILRYEIR